MKGYREILNEKKFVKSLDSDGKNPMNGYWYDTGEGNFILIDGIKSKKYNTYTTDFKFKSVPTDAKEIKSWKLSEKIFDVDGKEVNKGEKLPNNYTITKISKSKVSLVKGKISLTPQSPRSFLGMVYGDKFFKKIDG